MLKKVISIILCLALTVCLLPAAHAATTEVTVTGITAKDKAYDGTTSVRLDVSGAVITGLLAGDENKVTVKSATGHFENKEVGSKKVIIDSIALYGTNFENYSVDLANSQKEATASITSADIRGVMLSTTAPMAGFEVSVLGVPADADYSCQWYINSRNSSYGAVPIWGATKLSYTPSFYDVDYYIFAYVTIKSGNYMAGNYYAAARFPVYSWLNLRERYYTLSFETNGGSVIYPKTISELADLDMSQYATTRQNYTFAGWYSDKALTVPFSAKRLSSDATVYAKWTPTPSMEWFKFTRAYTGYIDVDEKSWFGIFGEGAVRDATQLSIMDGDSSGAFRPDDGLRLNEVIKMAAVIHNAYNGNVCDFTLDPLMKWYNPYINYAIENNIITYADFGGEYGRLATRAEMVYVLAHALPSTEFGSYSYRIPADVKFGDLYSAEIFLLYNAGVLCGIDENATFDGGRNVTRAEAAAIATRIILSSKRY